MDTGNLILITELMLIAVAVAVAVKYVRLPYTVALVLVGLAVGFSDLFPSLHLSKEVILFVFLPPLLFEGTLNMDLKMLRDRSAVVGVLALFGTLITTILMGLLLHWLLKLPLPIAMLLGAIITPTDPVSVLATFKEYGVTKGLSTIVEGESVFNDGIGVVLYLLLLKVAGGQDMTFGGAIQLFAWEVFAGAAIGVLLGYLTHLVLGKIDDHLIEVMISVILAYGSYLLAERIHCSGVVAVVCAGLIIGNYGRILSMSPKTRLSLSHFWPVVSFGANSLLFLLIGIDLDSEALFRSIHIVALVFGLVLLARSVSVYGLTALVDLFPGPKTPGSWRHAINWAGLRGSIPIALALGLPAGIAARGEMINIVFGVVLLSMLVQGLSIKPLLSKLGLIGAGKEQIEYEKAVAQRIAAKAALRELKVMFVSGEISDSLHDAIRDQLLEADREQSRRIAELKSRHKALRDSMYGRLARRLGYAQHTALQQAFIKGVIGDESYERAVERVDANIDMGIIGLVDEDTQKE